MICAFVSRLIFIGCAVLSIAEPGFANLIVNGDFEQGNTGFTSDYALGGLQNIAGSYVVIDNSANAHTSAFSYPDHTTGLGLMMMINGALSPGVIWRQTVPVDAGRNYDFSLWISSWFFTPGSIQLQINGLDVGPTFNAPSQHSQWQQYSAQWHAGASTSAQIELINTSFHSTGNDFSFDDISLVPSFLLGDLNGDGSITNGDIAPFVQALTDPDGYAAAYPALNPDSLGDFTGDGALTNGDINGFVSSLTLGLVPEPTSLALLCLGGLMLTRRRTR